MTDTLSELAFDVPPKGGRKQRADKGKPRGRRKASIAPKLEEQIFGLGGGLLVVGLARQDERLQYDANIILENAKQLAETLDKLGQENPKVRAALEMLVVSSTYSSLAMVVISMVVPMLANHGFLPPMAATFVGADAPPEVEIVGVVADPDVFATPNGGSGLG